jgi:hypothetical protein
MRPSGAAQLTDSQSQNRRVPPTQPPPSFACRRAVPGASTDWRPANRKRVDGTVVHKRHSRLLQLCFILATVAACSTGAESPLYQELKQEALDNGLGSYPLLSALDRSCNADCTIRLLLRDGFKLTTYVGPHDKTVRCGSFTLASDRLFPLVRNGVWPIDQFNYTIELGVDQDCMISRAVGHLTASSFV